jgi:hypothetical protein
MTRGTPATAAEAAGAGRLSGDGQRPRAERLHVRGAGGGVDARGAGVGGAGGDQRAEGARCTAGAPGPVIEMLDAIGEPANARAWIEAALDRASG